MIPFFNFAEYFIDMKPLHSVFIAFATLGISFLAQLLFFGGVDD